MTSTCFLALSFCPVTPQVRYLSDIYGINLCPAAKKAAVIIAPNIKKFGSLHIFCWLVIFIAKISVTTFVIIIMNEIYFKVSTDAWDK